MTGRTLYDKFCDVLQANPGRYDQSDLPGKANMDRVVVSPPVAWSFLSRRDQDVWRALAAKVTPKPRVRS